MSDRVDVLSVMQGAAFELRTVTTGNEGRVANQVDQACAAVAELIEAAKGIEGLARMRASELRNYTAAVDRLTAAIAAVAGAAK